VPEGLCFSQVKATDASGVSIRQYGFPAAATNATFASGSAAGAYVQGVQGSIAVVINYFSGANDEQRNILSARTVPFAVTPPGAASPYWTTYIEVSPTQFPDDFLIPRPNPGVTLSRVSADLGLVAVFQFNDGLPVRREL